MVVGSVTLSNTDPTPHNGGGTITGVSGSTRGTKSSGRTTSSTQIEQEAQPIRIVQEEKSVTYVTGDNNAMDTNVSIHTPQLLKKKTTNGDDAESYNDPVKTRQRSSKGKDTVRTPIPDTTPVVFNPKKIKARKLQWKHWLESINDDGHSSIGVSLPMEKDSTSTTGKRNNAVITPGVLATPNALAMWKFSLDVIHTQQRMDDTAKYPADHDLPRMNTEQVMQQVKFGIKPPFKDGVTEIPKRTYTNLIPEDNSPEAIWVDSQMRAMLSAGMVREEAYPGEATLISGMFLVEKDNGKGFRLIVNLKFLNEYFKKFPFTLHTLNKDRYAYFDLVGFDSDDLTSSYQHVQIHPDIQKYFGVRWRGRTVILVAAPYGASPLPQIFQMIASVGVRVNHAIGVSKQLTSVEDWLQVAKGDKPLPPKAERFVLDIVQFLDDYGKRYHSSIRSLSGRLVQGQELLELIPALSASFRTLMMAHGWVISPKSQRNPFIVNKYTGFNILTAINGGCFGIPVSKINKNVRILQEALLQQDWTFRTGAALAGRILQFKLVWKRLATMIARPFYHELARQINTASKWSHKMEVTPLLKEMLVRAIGLLSGSNAVHTAPVVDCHGEKVTLWERGGMEAFCTDDETGAVAGDASDYQIGGYFREDPRCMLGERLEHDIVKHGHRLQFWKELSIETRVDTIMNSDIPVYWKLISVEERLMSSTYRELVFIFEFYSDKKVVTKITNSLLAAGKKQLIHITDSQAARFMLHNGASKSPIHHRLVLSIWDITEPIRTQFGLFFVWLRRNTRGPEIADAFSKVKNWCIDTEIFKQLHDQYRFTLDAFASYDTRVRGNEATNTIDFCSRSIHELSIGDGRYVSWQNKVVWCFPPPESIEMVQFALKRCIEHKGIVVLCVAGFMYSRLRARFRSAPFILQRTLPVGSTQRIAVSPLADDNTLKYEKSRYTHVLFIFDNK